MQKATGKAGTFSRSAGIGVAVFGMVLGSGTWQSWGSPNPSEAPHSTPTTHPAAPAKPKTAASTPVATATPAIAPKTATTPKAGTAQPALRPPFFDPTSCVLDPSGVPLCWKADAQIFPDYWHAKDIKATATDLAPSEKERAMRMVTRAMRRYPASLLRTHLTAVYLVGTLRFSGISAGGTNSLDRVYVHDEGVKKGYTDAFLERTFHHEFSSVLLRLHTDIWDAAAWRACNAPDFAYGTNGTDAVRDQKASRARDTKLMARGFLNQYATASPEEDLNEMVEVVFCGTPEERADLVRYARLGRKAKLVRAFYTKLGVTFS